MLLHRPKWRASIAGAALLSLLTLPGPAPADDYFETVYLPTSSVVTMPASSVASTSYLMPASYTSYIPTSYSSYIPTSYSSYVPTSYTSTYIPTSSIVTTDPVLVPTTTTYFRRSLFPSRRLVERTSYTYASPSVLMPTTFVSSSILRPTTFLYDDSIVPTAFASSLCDTSTPVAPTRSTAKPPVSGSGAKGDGIVSEPTNPSSSNERRPSSSLNSSASGEQGMTSDVVPPVATPGTKTPPDPGAAPAATEKAPLAEPAPYEGVAPAKPTGTGEGGTVVPAPGTLGTKSPNEMMLRQARRPSTYETRNILRGRVVSADTKRPEEGVMVIITNETRKFNDRQAMTDADGEFKVSLPDGDWVVKVKMPSGTIYPVGRDYITASSGKITDVSGRNVGEMVIAR